MNNHFLELLLEGGAVWNVCYFTPSPLQQKHSVKKIFLSFHEALDSFWFSKIVFLEITQERIPGWPGRPQERVLGDLNEYVSGVAVFNACYFRRVFKILVLQLRQFWMLQKLHSWKTSRRALPDKLLESNL